MKVQHHSLPLHGQAIEKSQRWLFPSNGDLFFTDSPYCLEGHVDDPTKEIPFQGVYKVSTRGNASTNNEVQLLTDSITRPNGIALFK